MTGNAQVDHRKYFNLFTWTTSGGQFERLQDVNMVPSKLAISKI